MRMKVAIGRLDWFLCIFVPSWVLIMLFFEALRTTINTIKTVANFKKGDFSQKKKSEIGQCENTCDRFCNCIPAGVHLLLRGGVLTCLPTYWQSHVKHVIPQVGWQECKQVGLHVYKQVDPHVSSHVSAHVSSQVNWPWHVEQVKALHVSPSQV